MRFSKLPDLSILLARFEYCPETGLFIHRVACGPRPAGAPAGHLSRRGYIKLSLSGREIFAHRVAWYVTYKREPEETIDHINGVKTDNRIVNLREMSFAANSSLRHRAWKNKNTNLIGAYWNESRKKWQAQFKNKHLGWYETDAEAHQAYKSARGV